MKNFIRKIIAFSVGMVLLLVTVSAQPTNARGWYERSDIEEVEIGWIKTLQFKEPAKPFTQNGWSYTARQTDITQKIATWIQQSLNPRGMLGEMKLSVLAPEPSESITSKYYTFNEAEKNNRKAFPNTYGAYAKFYMLLQKTSTKKFWPINGLADYFTWEIMANNVQMITKQMVLLSSPDEYYCTMPRYTIGMKGEYDKDWMIQYANYRDFTSSPALQKYDHYLIPSGAIDHTRQYYYTVILTRDNQPLPFEQVTVAQFISQLEKQLPLMHTIAINNDTKLNNLLADAQRGIQILKRKFKDQQSEFVYILGSAFQPDILSLAQIEEGKSIHWLRTQAVTQENRDYTSTSFPLLRLKKGVKENLAASGPQWIVCRLTKGGSAGNAGEIHLMETFVNRFNYDYMYDFFFGKEKVIHPYKPLPFANAQELKNKQTTIALSEEAQRIKADKSVLYFEDFSATPNGATPANWYTQKSEVSGNKPEVTEVEGDNGKWLKFKRTAYPTGLSLPQNDHFTISFDILTKKGDVPWGTPGIALDLYTSEPSGNKGSSYRFGIDVSPGDMNRSDAAGWVMIGGQMPEGYRDCKIESYYSLPEFTGSKSVNKVNMAIRRQGETMTVLCNGRKVFECARAVPASLHFKTIRFQVNEKNVYHISNVMVKETK